MKHNIIFMGYDGEYPNLCIGTCVLKINGELYEFELVSGGDTWFDNDWNEHIEYGPWRLSECPSNLKDMEEEILEVINNNIPYGCCGGCI